MLRLRPSELTLTPEDVEETFRRMAHRQALKSSRHVPLQPCGRPVLRRGPQRAVRDAVTTLGDIPILRPQPQQAVQSSVDEDMEEGSELQSPDHRDRVDGVSVPVSPTRATPPVPATTSTSSTLRILQLPFRLGRGHRVSAQEESDAGEANPLPGRPSTHPRENSGAGGRRRDPRDEVPDPSSSTPTQSPAELRGGGRSGEDRGRHSPRDISAASPLRHVQRRSPPLEEIELDDTDEIPEIVLKGYFKDPNEEPKGVSYWFDEYRVVAPQTEPRRRSGRQAVPTRSLSSGSAPTYASARDGPGHSGSSADLVFSSGDVPRPPVRHGHRPLESGHHQLPGTRQFSSEASGVSEAYSYYQLPPDSRQASSSSSAQFQRVPSQLDGSAPSRHGRGTYDSIHPSQLNPPVASSSMAAGNGGHHGFSPLPSMPYGQTQGGSIAAPAPMGSFPPPPIGSFPPPPIGNFPPPPMGNSASAPPYPFAGYLDASRAATQGLPSPLDPYSNYYHNLMHPRPTQQIMPPPPSPYQYPPHGFPRQSFGDQSNLLGRPGVDDHVPCPYQPPPPTRQPTSALGGASRHTGQGRDTFAARASQRSSENVPVVPSDTSDRPNRHSQVQRHREAFERLHNAELPPPAGPRDASNRPRTQDMTMRQRGPTAPGLHIPRLAPPSSSSPLPPLPQSNDPSPGSALGTSPAMPPTAPPRHGSNMRGGGRPERSQTRTRRQVTPIPPPMRVNHARDMPSTSLALGHASARTSIRSPIARATTSARQRPRVPPHRRNQENSGAAEEELMRAEEMAVNARYGEDVQREVMDETPPRVGRMERRMFS